MKDRVSKLKVSLISHTPEPEIVVATAMRQSRFPGGVKSLKLSKEETVHLIETALRLGHFSVFEHIIFTFAVEGISRSCSHQFVRHRFFSFTQQSQRYIKEKDFEYIVPDSINSNRKISEKFSNFMNKINEFYAEMIKSGIPPEDARFLLPNATETKMVATANGRELMHFFKLRLDSHAQWEIRRLAFEMFKLVSKVSPNIFNNENIKYFE